MGLGYEAPGPPAWLDHETSVDPGAFDNRSGACMFSSVAWFSQVSQFLNA